MDKSTLIGVLLGLGVLGSSIFLDAGWQLFFNLPSFLIVMGGAFAAVFINFPMKDVIAVMQVTKKTLLHQDVSPQEYIEKILDLSKKARTSGLLGIEEDLKEIDVDFLKEGMQQVVNGTEAEDLKNILEAELGLLGQRHKVGQKIYMALATYAPAFGMIGTLLGLIKMLQSLDDPAGIGPGMALAMITTLYGALFANLFFMPMAGKLKQRSEEEVLFKEMLLQGILSVQAEESPRVIKNKLLTFLAPKERQNGELKESEAKANE
ncbi:MAG: motility protein A [bacterium]